jgi:hypothetical protein
LKARGLHEYLTDNPKTDVGEAQTAHILRENIEYAQFKTHFKKASHVSEVWKVLKQRWEEHIASKLLVCEHLHSREVP